MKNKVHTVIFDLDGTLSDSAILTISALGLVAPKYGFHVPDEETVRRTTGYANPEFYYMLFPDYPREKVLEMGNLVEHVEARLLLDVSDRLLFDGCRELLSCLKECGIRMNIASTGSHKHVLPILRQTGIIDFFDIISCGRPDKTEMLSNMIGADDKSGYLMVGDMKKDSDSARMCGILSVGACYGYCRRELTEFDLYINSPWELLMIISLL